MTESRQTPCPPRPVIARGLAGFSLAASILCGAFPAAAQTSAEAAQPPAPSSSTVAAAAAAAAAPRAASKPGQADPVVTAARLFRVSYVSATVVYLDGGREDGLAAGTRLDVRRQGEPVAQIEVDFVAAHSASCRVVSQRQNVRPGDQAMLAASQPSATATTVGAPAPGAAPTTVTPPQAAPAPYRPALTARSNTARTRISGGFSLGLQAYSDRVSSGGGYDEGTGRLNLRAQEILGSPLEFRARLRTRQTNRNGFSSATDSRSDRLYELSLNYEPPEGRFSGSVGRLGASPFVGIGFLDGAIGQLRLTQRFYVGVFGGSRPEVMELGLASAGAKYGAFVRYATRPNTGPAYGEVVLGGVGEYAKGGEVSREYVSIESRFGNGARWSLFQRAEIDLNRDWRQTATGTSNQISNAYLSASVQLNKQWRAFLSYDQHRNYLTWETRLLPEDVFNRFLRQGARASLEWRGASGWSVSGSLGEERQANGGAATTSAALSVTKNNLFGWGLFAGADASTYTGDLADGYVATLRLRKFLRGGHDLGLTLGASEATLQLGEPRANQWIRVSSSLELPYDFYLIGEVEYNTGVDLKGERYSLEFGYRF